MRRNKRKESSSGVLDASREGEIAPIGGGGLSRGTGTRVRGQYENQLMLMPKPELIKSPFGSAYLTRRTRPILADARQAVIEWWVFNISGRQEINSPTPALPNYDSGTVVLENWYPHARSMAKQALKYKHTPTTLNDSDVFRLYLDCYAYALLNLTLYFNLTQLSRFNEGTTSLNTYTFSGGRRARASRAWDRLGSVPGFKLIKQHALRAATPYYDKAMSGPIIRVWGEDFIIGNLYGVSGNYTNQQALDADAIFTSDTNLNAWFANIESAIEVCEGRVNTALTPADDDVRAITDLIDMIRDIVPGVWERGLPDPKSLPGYTNDLWMKTQLLGRLVTVADTFGVGGDTYGIMPNPNFNATLKTPVITHGAWDPIYDFTFMGAAKLAECANSVNGRYTAKTNQFVLYGTDTPANIDRECELYTREDGWVSIDFEADFGDGAEIRNTINEGHFMLDHPWMPYVLVDGQLINAGTYEFRFVDEPGVPIIWVDYEDFGENHAFLLSETLKVPYS